MKARLCILFILTIKTILCELCPDGRNCPGDTSCCSNGCCSVPRAVCCPELNKCCPEGTSCSRYCDQYTPVRKIFNSNILPSYRMKEDCNPHKYLNILSEKYKEYRYMDINKITDILIQYYNIDEQCIHLILDYIN